VIRTQAQADASRPIPITNGGATINGQRLTGIARNVIVSENEGKSVLCNEFKLPKNKRF
jgi:hypothetical protein